jgi:predicted HAD superfamily phosphohydrolase YqeG
VSTPGERYGEFSDERELPDRLEQLSPRTLIIDIEPLVAYWHGTQHALDRGIAHVLDLVTAVPSVAVVCFATNSARRPSVQPRGAGVDVVYLASARKPVQIAPYLSFPRPGVVIGDQVLTDGLLAKRLGYAYLHYRAPLAGAPIRPQLLEGLGRLARRPLFGPGRRPGSAAPR